MLTLSSLKKREEELIEAIKEIILLKKDAINRCSDVHKSPETEDQPTILGVKFSGSGSSDKSIYAKIKTLEVCFMKQFSRCKYS